MMLGSVIKTFWAQKMGIDAKDIVLVSFMPCTAKKGEIVRPEFQNEVWSLRKVILKIVFANLTV